MSDESCCCCCCCGDCWNPKTPLGARHMRKIPQGCEFTPGMLVEMAYERWNQHVGMVIDLTNTKRYYDALDWRKLGVAYVKVTDGRAWIHGIECSWALGEGVVNRSRKSFTSLSTERFAHIDALQRPRADPRQGDGQLLHVGSDAVQPGSPGPPHRRPLHARLQQDRQGAPL